MTLNDLSKKYFIDSFYQHKAPISYCKSRGISEKTIKEFGIGYAPNSGLFDYLIKESKLPKEAVIEQALSLGLIRKSKYDEGYYDYFRNRLIFPISNINGETIGFGGRGIDPKDKIKYLNSSESKVFIKGEELYNQERRLPNKSNSLILSEGYMDVIALEAYGFPSVASLGTALTPMQGKKMKNIEQLYICFDGDEAGIKATLRSIEIFIDLGIFPKVITIPDGMDPDDYLKLKGRKGMELLVKQAKNCIEYVVDVCGIEEALPLIDRIKN